MRAPCIALALFLISCGGGGSGDDDGDDVGVPDASTAIDANTTDGLFPACGRRWRLEPRDATSLELIGSGPAAGGRITRFAVGTTLGPCEEIAMPQVSFTLENEFAIIQLYAWVPVGVDCDGPSVDIERPVSIQLYQDAQWSVTAQGFATPVVLAVGADPGDCDPNRTPCEADCDCAFGEKCLSYDGFGGPTTGCGVPCEADRDCAGGTCQSIADGLDFACEQTPPECGVADACPTGWTCGGGACAPDFVLSQTTRHECGCDDDCDPGLRCIEATNPATRPRCQAACETGGDWCQGPHFCGSMFQDVSGLAGTDSVCGWIGE